MIEEVFCFPFLLQVGLCSLLHQVLQVIGVLLHPGQQVVQYTGAAFPMGNTDRVDLDNIHTNRLPVKSSFQDLQDHSGFEDMGHF